MKHNFTKTKFTDNQLKLILILKDLLTSRTISEKLLDDIYYITTAHSQIKDLTLPERVKIASAHTKYCDPISDKRLAKIRLYNDNELSENYPTMESSI